MRKGVRVAIDFILAVVFGSVFIVLACFLRRKPVNAPRLVFGPTPLINNKYLSEALRSVGFKTKTLMKSFYSINKSSDFDQYYKDFYLTRIELLNKALAPYFAFFHVLLNYDIVHVSYDGGFLNRTPLKFVEFYFYKQAKIKVVLLPYGGDFHRYSQIQDLRWRHALMTHYPKAGMYESEVAKRVSFLNCHADCVIMGQMIDGASRWDLLPMSYVSIDEKQWVPKTVYSSHDGKTGKVRVIHTPNHRGVKGTEYIQKAVNDLIKEGYQIELMLMEGFPNDKVRRLMLEADILVEQLVAPGYGLSAIEGMSSGLPVMSHISDPQISPLLRAYSYLDQCPIFSSNIDTIKDRLRSLVENPALRKELGVKGRQYVEKFHSALNTQIMFGKIYQKIWFNQNIDLINYFHPLIGQYDSDYAAARAKQQELQGSC